MHFTRNLYNTIPTKSAKLEHTRLAIPFSVIIYMYTVCLQEVLLKQSQVHLLLLRHQFKIAFYTEMKEEPAAALK